MSNTQLSNSFTCNYIMQIASIGIRGVLLSTIITTIENILLEIECITFKKVQESNYYNGKRETMFEVEYGTLPKIRSITVEQRFYYNIFMYSVRTRIHDKAIEWFPHYAEKSEEPEDDLDNLIPTLVNPLRCWCITFIEILLNPPYAPDSMVLEFNRYAGDHLTKNWISRYVGLRFKQEMESISDSRMSYLSLMEGCPETTSHIERFLFDENIVREICSYIEMPIISDVYKHPRFRLGL